jgi:isoquinoline 1-oxidoreductase beta subunit
MAINRRSLLIASGVGAGLVVGWAAWPRRHAVTWAAGPDEQIINAWVKVGTDGRVVVAMPQAEMGQGIWSGLAQVLADELGADWRTVSVEPAPLGAAYVNGFAASEPLGGLPELIRGIAKWSAKRVVEHYEMQLTGGSSSIRGMEATLRIAGAAAREMLCKAAAKRWSVGWQECDTAGGFVTHKANRLPFAELAAEAARIDLPSAPTLRTSRTLSGQSLPRLDIPAKVDGTAQYGADIRLPGQVYAAIAQGPIGATRTSVDKSKLPAGCTLVEQPGFVAVVANTWWQAKTGLESLGLKYKPAETPAGAWIDTALSNALDKTDGLETKLAKESAPAAALLTAPPKEAISADYALPFLAHACMETMTATAQFKDGRCEVWTPTQSLTLTTWAVARALGVEDDTVTVYPTLLGGGFGRKIESDAAAQAALIARAVGKPVQLVWSREEDFAHDRFRPAVTGRLTATLTGTALDTRISAIAIRIAAPDMGASVMARNLPAIAGEPKASGASMEGLTRLSYSFSELALEHVLVNYPVPTGFWRSVGNSYTAFMLESFMDELAAAASLDPVAFRLLHLQDSPRHTAVLKALTTASGGVEAIANGDGSITGAGLAIWECFGSIVAVVAEVLVRSGEPPKVIRLMIAADCGRVINPDSVIAQLEGAALYGLSAALSGRITFTDGVADQRNFDTSPLLDLASTPIIETILIESDEAPGGVGEVATPPIAPAIANALVSARVPRARTLPLGGPITRKPVPAAANPAPAAKTPETTAT